MDGIIFIVLFMAGLVWTLYSFFRPSSFKKALEQGIKDVKEGRVHSYKSVDDIFKEDEKWEKAHPVLAFFKDIYWYVRRFFIELIEFPRNAYRTVKRGIQRGYRGWADEDTWNLEHYLAKVTYHSLKRLFTYRNTFRTGHTGNEDKDWNVKESNEVKKAILYAWKLQLQISEGEREAYYPQLTEKQRKKFKALTTLENMKLKTGMKLFFEHFGELWD